jgi:hypothetical protein
VRSEIFTNFRLGEVLKSFSSHWCKSRGSDFWKFHKHETRKKRVSVWEGGGGS